MKSWKKEFASLILDDLTENQAMRLKAKHFPRRLFRFGKFDEKGFWEAPLLKHQLWLSSPHYFNDPFDCAFVMDRTIIEAPMFTEMIYQTMQQFYPDCYAIAKTKKFDDIKEFISNINENSSGNAGYYNRELSLEQMIESILDVFNLVPIGGLKVLCFSEVHDLSTMWGHYADHHRGFCISYDFMSDPRQRTSGKGVPLYPNIWPVIYQSQRVDFGELYKQGKLSSVTNATLFKSPDWKYEKEWRLVWSDYFHEHGTYVKDGGCMREIYLGAKVDLSEKNIKRILRHADNIGVPVFKMGLSNNTYKLIAVPINSSTVRNV